MARLQHDREQIAEYINDNNRSTGMSNRISSSVSNHKQLTLKKPY